MKNPVLKDTHEDYICESCGFTSAVPNETCPECGSPMTTFGNSVKSVDDEALLSDDEILKGVDLDGSDGTPLSLEALQEDEEAEDRQSYEKDSFGDE